jgi:hypothetical protein
MLRITRAANGEVVFRLSGRIDAENLSELESLLSAESKEDIIVLDLKELRLADQAVISFFRLCETKAASSSRIAQHTFASGSKENGKSLRNKKSRRLRWNLPECSIVVIESLPHVDLSRS